MRKADRQGWHRLQSYLNVHYGHLERFANYFVVADELEAAFISRDRFAIRGRVRCDHALFVDVDKVLAYRSDGRVRTIRYSYHAGFEGPVDRPIFRYDNDHRYSREGHPDEHHKHRFDPVTWQEIEPPEWVGRDRWPHLSDVLEELWEWWREVGRGLNLGEPTS